MFKMQLLYCETLTGLKKPYCKYRLNMVSLWKHSCPSHFKYGYYTFQWVPSYLWNSLQLSQYKLITLKYCSSIYDSQNTTFNIQILPFYLWNTVLYLCNTVLYLWNNAAVYLKYPWNAVLLLGFWNSVWNFFPTVRFLNMAWYLWNSCVLYFWNIVL